jgi:hypothetical protein
VVRPKQPFIWSGVESKWTSYGPFWAIAIILWCGNSVVLLGVAPGLTFFVPALVSNLVAATALTLTIVMWGRIHRAVSRTSPVTLWIVLVAGACVGLVKGLSTFTVFWSMTEMAFTLGALVTQSIAPMIIGMWLLPTFGVIGSVRQRYSHERDVLINERVAHNLQRSAQLLADTDLDALIRTVHQGVTRASSPRELTMTLQLLAERDVRRTSHVMWETEAKDVRNYSLGQLSWNAIRNHQFPAFFMSLTLFFSLVSFHVPQVGISEAFLRSAFQSLVTFIVFYLGKKIPPRGSISGPVVFFATPIIAVITIDLTTLQLFGPLPESPPLISGLLLFASLTSAALVLGVLFSARQTHIDIREELDRLHSRDISAETERALRQIRRRETAELLHGYVQNQLMVSALKIQDDPTQTEVIKTELFDLLDRLEAGTIVLQPADVGMAVFSGQVTELWRGVIDVTVDIHASDELSQREYELIDRIVHELISNAHRHGRAHSIDVHVTITQQSIFFSADDTGDGPQLGTPGLGSTILSAATAGRWKMNSTATGTNVNGTITRAQN